MQSSLLNMATPVVHCQFYGHAARHLNSFDDFICVVNSEHKVDVFKRGNNRRVKTLDIEYMRYSLKIGNRLFIGTEEKRLFLVDAVSFEILDSLQTQSYIFTLVQLDPDTVLCGQFGGFIDMIRCNYSDNLIKVAEQKLPVGNIYKMVRTHNEDEFIMGCGEGLFFMTYSDL